MAGGVEGGGRASTSSTCPHFRAAAATRRQLPPDYRDAGGRQPRRSNYSAYDPSQPITPNSLRV